MEVEYRGASSRGTFVAPRDDAPHPTVLALGGSDGGTPSYFADLLVPEGFACLSLAYWATPETQPWFTEIPLERIEHALRWLAHRPGTVTHDGRVALVGASKGAELALLVAAAYPELVGPVVPGRRPGVSVPSVRTHLRAAFRPVLRLSSAFPPVRLGTL